MKLTSMEIRDKEFKKSIRGYDMGEVQDFLEKVSEDYEYLYKENSSLKEKMFTLNEKLEHFAKMEETIQNTLVLAQNAADQAKQTAQREADMIIKNANDTAQRVLDKAQNNVMQINDEFERTKREFAKFRAKFRNFMTMQMDTFNEVESDFIKNYNIGSAVESNVDVKGIEEKSSIHRTTAKPSAINNEEMDTINNDIDKHLQNFKIKNINEDEVKGDNFNDIKSFFAND